jgi:hypothetical protein
MSYSLSDWQNIAEAERSQIENWELTYSPEALAGVNRHVTSIFERYHVSAIKTTPDELLAEVNSRYMKLAEFPQVTMLRLPFMIANEILLRGDIDVYRLSERGAAKLSPLDALKNNGELAFNREDLPKLGKWAERKVTEVISQRNQQQKATTYEENSL